MGHETTAYAPSQVDHVSLSQLPFHLRAPITATRAYVFLDFMKVFI